MAEQSTLIADIYSLVENGKEISQVDADEFGKTLSTLISDRLQETKEGGRKFTLRMSNIGKGTRQLWYDKKYGNEEKLEGHTLIKFIFGDIIEALVLFLADQSGHTVSERQAEVSLGGIKGHIDADIDGDTVDVKSASTYSFKKFKDGSLVENDPFGYIEQIAGYSKARGTPGAFLAVDKQNGHLAYLRFTKEELGVFDIDARIEYVKKAVDLPEPPERCYPDEAFQEGGNRKLGINCSYCGHKERCWADSNNGLGLRKFAYSTGPVWLTKVVKEPKVYEIPKF